MQDVPDGVDAVAGRDVGGGGFEPAVCVVPLPPQPATTTTMATSAAPNDLNQLGMIVFIPHCVSRGCRM
jgi:hypothetical protein